MAIATDCAPPPLSAATAYGPPGTARSAGPPSVLTDTDSGAAAKLTVAGPPPVVKVAVAEVTSWASRVPPPVSARSGPVTPRSISGPPSVLTVSGPPMSETRAGPPPVSRFAPATPETVAGPPWVATLTVTPNGTVRLKLTLQFTLAHAGSDRVRRPPDTDCATAGGPSPWGSYMIVSVTWTRLTCPAVTCTSPPLSCTVRLVTGCGTVSVRIMMACGWTWTFDGPPVMVMRRAPGTASSAAVTRPDRPQTQRPGMATARMAGPR